MTNSGYRLVTESNDHLILYHKILWHCTLTNSEKSDQMPYIGQRGVTEYCEYCRPYWSERLVTRSSGPHFFFIKTKIPPEPYRLFVLFNALQVKQVKVNTTEIPGI